MTPADRAALAAALKDATPAMLREDAARHIGVANALDATRWPGHPGPNDQMAAWHRRAAALALACADLEENGRSVLFGITKTGRVVLIDEDGPDYAAKGDTLPRALAALLKGDQ